MIHIKEENQRDNILTTKMLSLLTYKEKNLLLHPSDNTIDIVYINKESEENEDLRYSLRSLEKFCTFRDVWIIGYKPSWVTNVKHIPTVQLGTKWKNSTLNWLAACQSSEISENFILMNDDFFTIRPLSNWAKTTNLCLGTIKERIQLDKQHKRSSKWMRGFKYAEALLTSLKCDNQLNYEAHTPMLVNKKDFIKTMSIPCIVDLNKTNKVLMKRSMYKNLFPHPMPPKAIADIKLPLNVDLSDKWLNRHWISVFDDVVGDFDNFPILNTFLTTMFPTKSKFEI